MAGEKIIYLSFTSADHDQKKKKKFIYIFFNLRGKLYGIALWSE